MTDDRVADIRQRLQNIAEELDELAYEALREAVDAGADKRPDTERKLTRARSAIEKAVANLGSISGL